MRRCLYCLQNEESTTFKSIEHVIPESIGNTSIVLEAGIVCDRCNNGVLSHLDQTLIEFDPISFLRVNYSIPSKSGKLPKAKFGNMVMEATAPNKIHIKTNSKSTWVDSHNGFTIHVNGSRKWTKIYQKKLCRALFKITLGLIYKDLGETFAFSERYHNVREIILGTRDFQGYLAIANKAKIVPESRIRYDFLKLPNGLETTWVEANFMGVTLFTDLETRVVNYPDLLEDKVTLFTF